jgi:cysteate synthase
VTPDYSALRASVPEPLAERHYRLACAACGHVRADYGLALSCDQRHRPALLRSFCAATDFEADQHACGLPRYQRWLPVIRSLPSGASPVVYWSERLGRALGLQSLWIAFNGCWPERGALCPTGSFKDLEAPVVLGRLPESPGMLAVARSGNTGAAFASGCADFEIPRLNVVPEHALGPMRLRRPASGRAAALGPLGSRHRTIPALCIRTTVRKLP